MTEFHWRPRGNKAAALAVVEPKKPLALPAAMRARFDKPKAPSFKASPQQLAYFDWIENGKGNALLQAVAGAGKTTTLIHGFRYMQGSIFCGAYNRSAADDIKRKAEQLDALRPGLYISTVHASGLYDWRRIHKTVEIDDRKVHKLIDRFVDQYPAHKPAKDCAAFIHKMVSFGKQFLIGCKGKPEISNMAIWYKLMDHFSADQDLPEALDPEAVLEWVCEIFRMSRDLCPTKIDFDDMIYAPIAHDIRLFPNDWVLVDECQDINPARREMARRLLKRGGRAVFVGDRRQAIYGFTGAGGDSIDRIVEEFQCQELPLTVTYRCPKAVVEYVHQWVSHIEAHPDAPDGVVRPVKYEKPPIVPGQEVLSVKPWFIQDAPAISDVVICRYTRPLIQTAYAMIKEGVACKVEGRDIGNGLIALCRMWKISTIARLEERIATYLAREIAKAQKVKSEKRQQEVEDKVETLRVFIIRCREQGKTQIDDLVAEISAMFADDVKDVVKLCTGHKSKGREWGRVFWIQTAQRGRPSKDWEFMEETNVKYVIGTRAQQELILVPELIGG